MLESVLLVIFLLAINLLLAYKPIPILAFPIGLATFGILASNVLYDASLPYQPFLTLLFMVVVIGCLIVNAYEFRATDTGKNIGVR